MMDRTLQVQTQIRQNAEEISTALGEMKKWEKLMKKRDENIATARKQALRVPRAPIRSGVGTVPVKDLQQRQSSKSTPRRDLPAEMLTPSSIVDTSATSSATTSLTSSTDSPAATTTSAVPRARGSYQPVDAEEVERERGNTEFKAGNFTSAVKSYTKCLGLKARNYVAFSNRAMAYIKLKEFARAVSDCSSALLIEPAHVKSLLRRATAYNAQGKHRAALRDLIAATALDPGSKQLKSDLQTTREQMRSAVNRAPLVMLASASEINAASSNNNSSGSGSNSIDAIAQGPDFCPPNYQPELLQEEDTAETAFAEATLHRVAIADDDDHDGDNNNDDVAATTSKTISTAVDVDATANENTSVQDLVNICDQQLMSPVVDAVAAVAVEQQQQKRSASSPLRTGALGKALQSKTTATSSTATANKSSTTATNKTNSSKTRNYDISSATDAATTTAAATTAAIGSTATTTASISAASVSTTVTVTSSYDLERALILAGENVAAVGKVLKPLTLRQVRVWFRQLMEPNVLFLLLHGVHIYYGEKRQQWHKVFDWFNGMSSIPAFSLLYSLLLEQQKETLRGALAALQANSIAAAASTDDDAVATTTTTAVKDDTAAAVAVDTPGGVKIPTALDADKVQKLLSCYT